MEFRGEVFVTIQNQDGTQEVTHLMPETNRFEDPRCQTSDSADSNNLPWSETGPPWTILGIFLNRDSQLNFSENMVFEK